METSINTQVKPKIYTKRKLTDNQLEAIRAKRAELKILSNAIKILVKEGKYDSVNEGLIDHYNKLGHESLKTMRQWNEVNMSVKKGEHALLLWGSPKKNDKKDDVPTSEDSEKEEKFYPLCFVFSQKQVQPMAAK